MRSRPALTLAILVSGAALAHAQAAAGPAPRTIQAYVLKLEIKALAPELKTPDKAPGEAEALMSRLRQQSQLTSRVLLSQDLSRQEIVSTDFILPAGTLVMHKAGDKYYAIADPKTQTFLAMDSEGLLTALEGGAGIANSKYEAKVQHTAERKTIAGYVCRKSIVKVTYVSSVPLENSSVLVQQQNDIEVWHTPDLVSAAAMEHFFFKFQRDKTGTVQKVLATELGFPMEVNFVVTQGAGTKKGPAVQPGSFHVAVSDVKVEKVDAELFTIPPAGYKRIDKSPYFRDGGLSTAGAAAAASPKP
jgi:hypothetical protein